MDRVLSVQLIKNKASKCHTCLTSLINKECELALYEGKKVKKNIKDYKIFALPHCKRCNEYFITQSFLNNMTLISKHKILVKPCQKAKQKQKKTTLRQKEQKTKPVQLSYGIVEHKTNNDYILIICADCKDCFEFSYGEHLFYVRKNIDYPIRCKSCRNKYKEPKSTLIVSVPSKPKRRIDLTRDYDTIESFIMWDSITNKKFTYHITQDKNKESSSSFYIKNPFSEAIKNSIIKGKSEFEFNGIMYKIDFYKKDGWFCNQNKNAIPISSKQIIWIYIAMSNIKCFRCNHKFKDITALVKLINSDDMVEILIHQCLNCINNNLFISETSLELYENKYGKLSLKKIPYEAHYQFTDNKYFDNSNTSELYLHGYTVKEGASVFWRQYRLKYLMDNEIMSKAAIIRNLSNNIRRFEEHCNFIWAIQKWKEDLMFVNEYKSEENEVVIGGSLKYRSDK